MQAKKEMLAIKSLNERLGEDTDWIDLNNYISYKKQNGIVFVIGRGNGSCEIGMGGEINNQSARIEVNGNISLYLPAEKTTSNWAFNISFPI